MKAPVFVKIEKYREIEETISQIKAKIQEAQDILNKIQQLKAEEEHEIATWKGDINDVEEKVRVIERSIMQ